MKVTNIYLSLLTCCLCFSTTEQVSAQSEPFGLSEMKITAFRSNYGMIVAGTESKGVFKLPYAAENPDWDYLGLEGIKINDVYPHDSGAAITIPQIGIAASNPGDTVFVYCWCDDSLKENSKGISYPIHSMDGYPSLAICGESFALGTDMLYVNFLFDSTWTELPSPLGKAVVITFDFIKATNRLFLGMSGGFAGTVSLMVSYNMGESWIWLGPSSVFGSSIDLETIPGDTSTLYFLTYGGLLRTSDFGANWEETSLPDTIHLSNILISEFDSGVLVGGGYNGSSDNNAIIVRSNDGGDSWDVVTIRGGSRVVGLGSGWDGEGTEFLYYATEDSGVFRIPFSFVSDIVDEPVIAGRCYLSQNHLADYHYP